MAEIFTLSLLVSVLTAAVRAGTPLFLATVGEIIVERSGVLNLRVEVMMIVGALTGFMTTYTTGNPWLGVVVAMLSGGLFSLLHGFLSITLKGNQVVSGIMLVLLGIGITSFVEEGMVDKRYRASICCQSPG